MSERENLIRIVQKLDSTNRHKDMIKHMKRVIEIDPYLNEDERNLLSVAYKNITDELRGNFRTIDAYIREDVNKREHVLEYLSQERDTFALELKNHCFDLIELIETKLIPATKIEQEALFYKELKADCYRYVCESVKDDEKEEIAKKADDLYKEALDIGKKELEPYTPEYLGIILNYSVFLCETLNKKDDAIELAKESYSKCYPLIDQNEESAANEARMILKFLEDNVNLWIATKK